MPKGKSIALMQKSHLKTSTILQSVLHLQSQIAPGAVAAIVAMATLFTS